MILRSTSLVLSSLLLAFWLPFCASVLTSDTMSTTATVESSGDCATSCIGTLPLTPDTSCSFDCLCGWCLLEPGICTDMTCTMPQNWAVHDHGATCDGVAAEVGLDLASAPASLTLGGFAALSIGSAATATTDALLLQLDVTCGAWQVTPPPVTTTTSLGTAATVAMTVGMVSKRGKAEELGGGKYPTHAFEVDADACQFDALELTIDGVAATSDLSSRVPAALNGTTVTVNVTGAEAATAGLTPAFFATAASAATLGVRLRPKASLAAGDSGAYRTVLRVDCVRVALDVAPATTTTTGGGGGGAMPVATTTGASADGGDGSGLQAADEPADAFLIVAVVVGGCCLLCLLAAFVLLMLRERRKQALSAKQKQPTRSLSRSGSRARNLRGSRSRSNTASGGAPPLSPRNHYGAATLGGGGGGGGGELYGGLNIAGAGYAPTGALDARYGAPQSQYGNTIGSTYLSPRHYASATPTADTMYARPGQQYLSASATNDNVYQRPGQQYQPAEANGHYANANSFSTKTTAYPSSTYQALNYN